MQWCFQRHKKYIPCPQRVYCLVQTTLLTYTESVESNTRSCRWPRTGWHHIDSEREKNQRELEWLGRASRRSKPCAWIESYCNWMLKDSLEITPTLCTQGKGSPGTGNDLPEISQHVGGGRDHVIAVLPLHHPRSSVFQVRCVYPQQWGPNMGTFGQVGRSVADIFLDKERKAGLLSKYLLLLCQKAALPKELNR